MSAYVVEDVSINRVVTWLFAKATTGGTDDYSWCLGPLERLGYQLDRKPECQRLARDMFDLNCQAVVARWGDGEAANVCPSEFAFEFVTDRKALSNVFQVLKSLDCFLYQCGEGWATDTPLCTALGKVADSIARQIVMSDRRYERAVWE